MVGCAEQLTQGGAHPDTEVGPIGVEHAAHAGLQLLHGQRRPRGDLLSQFHRGRQQLVVGHHPRHESPSFGGGGIDDVAGEEQLGRLRRPDQLRQPPEPAQIGHEATVSKVADEQLFYLMSRGLSEEQAMSMVVNGFIEPVTRTLPMEYAVEWSRLIELQMEGSVG